MKNTWSSGEVIKKAISPVLFSLIILCFMAGQVYALDYPHTSVNNIGCDSCHFIYGGEPHLLPEWTNHVPQDIDDTQYNVLCWSCHNDIEAPYVRTHSSLQIDDDYGDWTNECRTCHNPHSQDQLKAYTSASFLYSGTSTGITSTTLTESGAGWTDDEYIGKVLVPSVDRPTRYKYSYKITDNTSDTITVEGPIDTSRASIGDTFAVIYGKIIKNTITLDDIIDPMVPKTGDKTVRFFTDSGTNSFADGNSTYDGVCEVCHTETKYHQNDGGGSSHNAALDCMQCHFHARGFAHGSGGGSSSDCEECHGHDPGYGGFTGGKGTYVSHSTHTEDDSDDLRGPNVGCGTCHDTDNMPYFNSGTDADDDGRIDLSEADVCNACHSPNGTYNGVNDATIGAKNNWSEVGGSTSPVYAADGSLQSGKEKWCAGCHDEEPSVIQSVSAPNVIGDEDGDYTYGTGWGFYKTGHGLASGEAYPSKGGLIEPSLVGGASRPVECDSCHDLTTAHIDGEPRTFDDGESSSTDPSVYRQAYRLDLVPLGQGSGTSTREPLLVPRPTNSGNVVNYYRLCTTCHDSGPFLSSSDTNTNLVTSGVNRHEYHLVMNSIQYPADWNGGNTSMITCVVCHNVHGSTRLAMIRDGKLTGREPGLKIWYKNDSITENIGSTNPPSPEDLPLAASDGTAWINNTVHNLCVGCHNSGILEGKDRTPFQDTAQAPKLHWTSEQGYQVDGASPDSAASGSTFTFRVKYQDTNNDAPAPIEVWVDEDDNGSYDADEKYTMSGVDTGDVNYTNGKLYTKSLTLNSSGDNVIKYRFYATDGTLTATGDPTGDGSVTLTAYTENSVPLLEWVTGTCRYLGVSPAAEVSGTVYEFYVKYTDADDEFSSLQVWVDLNDDGDYDDASERQDMTVDGGDGDYSNGENFTRTMTLNYAGDGVLNYLFVASDGTAGATGEPAEAHSVRVIDSGLTPVTVCASGCDATTVQSAIDTAKSGDKLTLVYSGTYNERLSLWESSYSNSTVRSVCGPDDTTLTYSGDEVIFLQNVTGITIDGFEITGGTAGIDSNAGQATVNNCKIHGNNSAGRGGGLHAGNAASRFTVTNSEIYSNTAVTDGAGVSFEAGTGYSFTNTIIRDNTATGAGGAVFSQNGDIDFIDSTIRDNTSSGSGGAVYSNGSDINFIRTTITGNTSTSGNSGVIDMPNGGDDTVFENCIVADNQGVNGGVAFANTSSHLTAVNSTFADNRATGNGGAFAVQNATVVVRNSILWNNSAGSSGHIAWFNGGSMTVTDTVISSGLDGIPTNAPYFAGSITPTVSGYVSENDPNFVDAAGGDYHILSTSDAVDNADATYAPADDIDGDTRPEGSADDIGADEYVFSINAPTLAWTGETNYVSDGVDPDSAVGGTSFEFRIDYTDADNNEPEVIQVWIDEDDDGSYSSDEKYGMTATNGGDTDYTDGKLYSKTQNLAMAGDGDLSYRFYASDGTFEATGDPTSNSTVTVINNGPVLSWTGETNYTSDGVDPDSSIGGTSFEFRIDYTDADNTAPSSIQVWVDEDDSGTYEPGEKYDMTGTDGGDTTYTDGKRYTKSLNILYAGNGSLNYRFYASDGSDDATGTPASDQTVTVTNNAPTVAWTGETNYTTDGVDPDSGPDSGSFTFRIDYTDTDNTAPSSIQVWIDEDDSATYDEDEKYDMTGTDGGDSDYTDGKRYSVSRTLSYAGDGVYNYRFYASDGTNDATGDPVSGGTVTVTLTPNNAPVLAWTGETNYTADGVDPDSSHDGDTFTFRVKYTDDDDEAPTSIQVWIDEDDDTSYEAGEKYDMTAVDAGDTTYTDGKLYTVDRAISFAGDGVLNYRFYANDGTDDATGTPVTTGGTVSVVDPITVCLTGADFTTIQGAISDAGTTDGDYIRVCDGTYSENINFNGKNITVYSQNGSASTTIQGSGADSPVVTFSNSETSSAVLKGFTINNLNSGGASARGIVISGTASPTLTSLIVKGNNPASYAAGAAIYLDAGGVTINSSTIGGDSGDKNNSTYGSGIYAINGGTSINVNNSTLSYNAASTQGGAIYLSGRTSAATLTNTSVTNNTAGQNGGAILCSSSPLVIENSTIDYNQSTQPLEGGGLSLSGASTTLTISGTTSISNNSGRNGGAIHASGIGTVSISDTTIDNNSASSEGAGMLLSGMAGNVSLTNTNITNNTGTTSGAGMKFTTSTARSLTITNSVISNNEVTSSSYDCSGVCIAPSDVTGADVTVTITGSTISGNSARNAGGLSASSGTYSMIDLTITGSTFSSNEAKGGAGGGLSLNGSRTTVNISKSWIKGNEAYTHGGGIYNTAATTITNSFITGNLANGVSYSAGGGINSGGSVQAYNCTIAGNRVGRDGGGWSGGGTITNSIFWGNYAEGSTSHQINGSPTVSYSDVAGGFTGTGNIDSDPYLIDLQAATTSAPTTDGNFHICNAADDPVTGCGGESAAKDTASSTDAPSDDYDGDTRPAGAGYDMGADEIAGGSSNSIPALAWTGEANYTTDGVDPDSGTGGSNFIFRIKYTDADDEAPGSIQVWVDEDDSSTYEAGEKYDMTIDGGNGDYTDGEIFTKTAAISYTGDGGLNYRFYANDGTDDAIGSPTSNSTVTVTNTAPVLDWTGETNYTADGVDPDSGNSGGNFEFRIEYTDANNDAPSSIQVWIDEDDSSTYEAFEYYDLTETDGGDTDYTDGKLYSVTRAISYDGDGTLNYRFYASDGTDTATGTPTSDSTFDVVQTISGTVYTDEGVTTIADGATVRLIVNGSSAGTDTTSGGSYSIPAAISAGDAIIVYLDGAATDGTAVTVSDGGALSGLDIYGDRVITKHDNSGSLTNALMSTALGAYSDTEILYTISGGDLVVSGSSTELYIPGSHSFIPGGAITTAGMDINGTLDAEANAINVSGSWDATGGVFSSTGTVTFNAAGGTAAITPGGTDTNHDFQNIIFNDGGGSATYQLAGAIDIDGNLTLTDGIFDTSGSNYAVTVGGNFTQNGGQVTGNGSTFTVAGNFTADGSEDSTGFNNASLVLNGSGSIINYNNLTAFWANGFNNLTAGQSGVTDTLNNWLAVRNLLTIGTGELTGTATIALLGTPDPLSLNSAANLSVNSLVFLAWGGPPQNLPNLPNGYDSNIAVSGDGLTLSQTGDVTINAPKSLLITGDNTVNRAVAFNTAGYALTVGGDIKVGYGGDTELRNLNGTNSTITVGGDFNVVDVGGGTTQATFTSTGSTVIMNGTADQTITSSGSSFNNLTLNNTGSAGSDDVIVADAIDIDGVLTITDGDFDIGTNDPAVNTAGAVTIASSGSVDVTGRTADWTFDGTSTLTDSSSSGPQDLQDVVLNGTGLTLASNAKVETLTNTSGTLDLGGSGYIMEIDGTGTPFSNSGTFTAGTSTVKYTGSGSATNITTLAYSSLQLTPASATTYSLTGNLTGGNALTGNLTIDADATLDATGSNYNVTAADVTINGAYSAQGSTITLSGNWDNNGTFTTGTSSVVFSGNDQQLYGTATFYDLTKSVATAQTLTFEAGQTTSIATGGTVTLNGASGQLLSLASSTGSSVWYFIVGSGATKSISYVSVSWSDASGSDASQKPIDPTNSNDGGNNTDWFSGGGSIYTVCKATHADNPCDYQSINAGIDDAAVSSGDTLLVSDDTYSENINFDGKNITIKSKVDAASTKIEGDGSANAVVSFLSGESVSAVLDGFTIDNQRSTGADGRGVKITNSSAPSIKNCIIEGNLLTTLSSGDSYWGAGIYINGGGATIDNTIIGQSGTSNTANHGAGIYATNGLDITISNSTVSYNSGRDYAGIYLVSMVGTTTLTNTDVIYNSAGGYQVGGIYANASSISITGGSISNNTGTYGGGLRLENVPTVTTINNVEINSNTSSGQIAGGIYSVDSPMEISNGTTVNSNSSRDGAGIYLTGSYSGFSAGTKTTIDGSTIDGNNANGYMGGGILSNGSPLAITNSSITNNNGRQGAGLRLLSLPLITVITNSNIDDNYSNSTISGGGIYSDSSPLAITGGSISRNTGIREGAGIYLTGNYSAYSAGTKTTISGTTIDSNSSGGYTGGGIYSNAIPIELTGATISNNSAATGAAIKLVNLTEIAVLDNVTVSSNSSTSGTSSGGAIVSSESPMDIRNDSLITGNTAGRQGSALYVTGVYAAFDPGTVTSITDSTVSSNISSQNYVGGGVFTTSPMDITRSYIIGNRGGNGGGLYSNTTLNITNSVITGNVADRGSNDGGGLNVSGSTTITNSTIAGNYSSRYGGGLQGAATVVNSIFWGNTSGSSYPQINGGATVTYSDVEGGYTGTGNMNSDPSFVNQQQASSGNPTAAGDFHINTGSPVVDQGTSSGAPSDDIDGDSRPLGSGIDMGADEKE